MGDRTQCTLYVDGQMSGDAFARLSHAIELYDGSVAAAQELRADGWAVFDEVNYGEIPPEIARELEAGGVSYLWSWCEGGGYSAGIRAYFADTEESITMPFTDGEVMVPVHSLDNPQVVSEARRVQEFHDRPVTFEVSD